MNLFSRKSIVPPPSPSPSNIPLSGPEAFANNSVALKRCENGHDLAQQLADMFDERAQLELNYATQLHTWSRKWHNELTKSQEYGTNKKVWDQTATTGKFIFFYLKKFFY
jgi:hypothetical protein